MEAGQHRCYSQSSGDSGETTLMGYTSTASRGNSRHRDREPRHTRRTATLAEAVATARRALNLRRSAPVEQRLGSFEFELSDKQEAADQEHQ